MTGVLIGFALAVFIFLLEATVYRNLRSGATFRAVIRSSWVEWPLAMGLVYIGYVALLMGFGTSSRPTPQWVDTWSVLYFSVQIVLLGVAFGRGIDLARPGAIKKPIIRRFRIEALDATERTLRQQIGFELLAIEAQKANEDAERDNGVSLARFFKLGPAIHSQKSGEAQDIDLSLPEKLLANATKGQIQISVGLGDTIGPKSPLVNVRYENISSDLRELVNHGIHIGRSRREPVVQDVYREAINFASRTLISRQPGDLALSLDLIEGAFVEVDRAWKSFGDPSSHASPLHAFFPTTLEDEMARELRELAESFLQSNEPQFVAGISNLANQLMRTGERQDALLVLQQGLELHIWQSRQLHKLQGELQSRVASSSTDSPVSFYRGLHYSLGSESGDADERRQARKFLLQVTPAVIYILKNIVDADERPVFESALDSLRKAQDLHSISDEVEDLEFQASFAPDDESIASELVERNQILEEITEVNHALRNALFELGAWVAHLVNTTNDPDQPWCEYLNRLAVAIDLDDVARCLTRREQQHEFSLLRSWYYSDQVDSGADSWSGDGSEYGFLWAAILILLKAINDEDRKSVASQLSASTSNTLAAHLTSIKADNERWKSCFALEDIEARIDPLTNAFQEAGIERTRAEEQRIAEARLSPDRTQAFTNSNLEAFGIARPLIDDLTSAGRNRETTDVQKFQDEAAFAVQTLYPKRFMVEGDYDFADSTLGDELGRKQDLEVFKALIDQANQESDMTPDELAHVIQRLPSSDTNPRIYASDHPANRSLLYRSEHFAPLPQDDPRFGMFDRAVVLMVRSFGETDRLILAQPDEINLTQYSTENQEIVKADVRTIDRELASKLLRQGQAEGFVPSENDVEDLVRSKVWVDIRVAFEANLELTESRAFNLRKPN